MNKSILSVFLIVLALNIATAQKTKVKWGKVSQEEIDMMVVPFDSTAEAVILAKTGKLTYANGVMSITYFVRMKILSQNKFDEADVSLKYWSKDNYKNILHVQAQTINIENGEVIKTKVEKDKIFKEKTNEKWSSVIFTFPNIKIGSIIEYKYTLNSKGYFNLESWAFQNKLPVVYSEYSVFMPGEYIPIFTGRRITKKYISEATNTWNLDSIPALKEESYIGNYADYAETISFQVEGPTWKNIASKFLKSDSYISAGLHKKKIASYLSEIGSKPTLEQIYKYVQDTYTWDRYYSIFPKRNYSSFLSSKKGDAASINYVLYQMLKKAGYDASPLLISTRNHGLISKSFPLVSQFNILTVYVKHEGKEYFMDASVNNVPYNLTNKDCLNGEGFLLDHDNSRWITISQGSKTYSASSVKITFDSLMIPTYNCSLKYTGQHAIIKRKLLNENEKEVNFLFESDEAILSNVTIKNLEEKSKPLTLSFDVRIEDAEDLSNTDLIYLDPFLLKTIKKNPFLVNERYYPIEFEYPFKYKTIIEIIVPESHIITDIPKSKAMSLPEKSGKLIFNVTKMSDNKLTIVSSFEINKQFISARYYKHLQVLFSEEIANMSELVIIEKKKF